MARQLTTVEAAEYLRVKPTTLEQWRWKGNGPRYSKPAGRILYDPADLDRWIEDGKRGSTAETPTPRRRRGRPSATTS